MNDEKISNETKANAWERTKISGLLEHEGGRYYGRFFLGGKTKFISLNCMLRENLPVTAWLSEKQKFDGFEHARGRVKIPASITATSPLALVQGRG